MTALAKHAVHAPISRDGYVILDGNTAHVLLMTCKRTRSE
jgi:hypothetical protein